MVLKFNTYESDGAIESFISALMFFAPNFIFLIIPSLPAWIFMVYNFVLIWALLICVAFLRFNKPKKDSFIGDEMTLSKTILSSSSNKKTYAKHR